MQRPDIIPKTQCRFFGDIITTPINSAPRGGARHRRKSKTVDVCWRHAMVVDCRRAISGEPLTESVHRRRIDSRHRLLVWLVWPGDGRQHQEPTLGAGVEVTPAWLLELRETLVVHGDQSIAGGECLARDLPLTVRYARRDQHRADAGRGKERVATPFVLEIGRASCRERVYSGV